ncbi:MAG TPA: alpha/beta hydrolase [Saprospiraceae bacterium]|nr:alpha/beta hydrolase [Saprospiraceae bacterium]
MDTIIFLHGALGSSLSMIPLAERFSSDWNTRILSFNGHGEKAGQDVSFRIQDMALELNAFIVQEGLVDPVVFGYSMGGYVALFHALQFPGRIRKIITLATKFDWNEKTAAREAAQLDPDGIEQNIPAFAGKLRDQHGDHWKNVVKKTADMMLQLGAVPTLHASNLPEIKTPCMLCIGDQDRMVSQTETEWAARLLPNSSLQILEQTPHPLERVSLEVLSGKIREFVGEGMQGHRDAG